jgi:tRNA-dihydrouridine synthase B
VLDFSKKVAVLAPLAGYTDLPFRSVVKKFGADLTVSEMISSNALVYNSKKTLSLAQKSPHETPYSLQIAGNKIETIKRAVEIINEFDWVDILDLNSGCPAPKVVTHGSGSALLNDLPLLTQMLRIIKETSTTQQTSVKVRIGFNDKYPVDIAKACEDGGVDFIAVHGRTRKGQYKEEVDYDAIAQIKEAVSIPVIANGDITTYEKGLDVLEHTGADGVMIGRGAIGNPWIFWQFANQSADVTDELRRDIIIEHLDKMIEFYGDHGLRMFRKHLHGYSKGYSGASEFRQFVNQCDEYETMRSNVFSFFNSERSDQQ